MAIESTAGAASRGTGAHRTGRTGATGGGTGASAGHRTAGETSRGLCTFWLGGKRFGLEVGLIGEIVTIDTLLPVPMAPGPVRGLFNLRGTPTALLDLGEVLGLEGARADESKTTALVLRTESSVMALLVDRMEAVVPPDRGTVTQPTSDDHPAVGYFLSLDNNPGVVTVLEPNFLLERIDALRFLKEEA